VCLTVVAARPDGLDFEIGPETLARTTLGRLVAGDAVNLERPLRFGAALGGHLVLGHVDGVGTVEVATRVESTARVRIVLPGSALAPLLVPQGSVAVDGVSLTVAALDRDAFEVMVIPHTLAVTTFGRLARGQTVNLEMDVIGKYLQRSLELKGTT
jgi:riboflavin synthase